MHLYRSPVPTRTGAHVACRVRAKAEPKAAQQSARIPNTKVCEDFRGKKKKQCSSSSPGGGEKNTRSTQLLNATL